MFELGNNLRSARQHRRIDLVSAEQDTKIRSKYLAALEDEEFDILPGPVFVRGFLRTYARYLGLDPQLYVDEYNARFGRFEDLEEQFTPALGRPGYAELRATRGRRLMRTFAVVSMIALALLAWLGLQAQERDVEPAPRPSRPEPVEPAPSAAQRAAAALENASEAAASAPADPQRAAAREVDRPRQRAASASDAR